MEYLASIEWSFRGWEFDVTQFIGGAGGVWYAHDSGCSCPSPFEDHVFPDDYTRITRLQDFYDLVDSRRGRSEVPSATEDDIETARKAIEEALRA